MTEAEPVHLDREPPVEAPHRGAVFGLIEDYGHLRADAAKLVNNKVAHAFLVHLVQPGYTDNFDAVEAFLSGSVRSARYARPTPASSGAGRGRSTTSSFRPTGV